MNRTATDSFGSPHPVITFTYFMVMVIFSMIFLHPLWMILSFGGAFLYSLFLKGRKALMFFAGFVLPVMVVSSLINPLFNHQGMTILFYFRDNPITAESIAYGMATGLMFSSWIVLPSMSWVATRAMERPQTFDTSGTVREARGLASIT